MAFQLKSKRFEFPEGEVLRSIRIREITGNDIKLARKNLSANKGDPREITDEMVKLTITEVNDEPVVSAYFKDYDMLPLRVQDQIISAFDRLNGQDDKAKEGFLASMAD